jgi:hypothetical protein
LLVLHLEKSDSGSRSTNNNNNNTFMCWYSFREQSGRRSLPDWARLNREAEEEEGKDWFSWLRRGYLSNFLKIKSRTRGATNVKSISKDAQVGG